MTTAALLTALLTYGPSVLPLIQKLVADIEAGGQMIPEEVAYHRTIAAPAVEFRVWPGVGHLLHTARPEQFTEELAAFLASHTAPRTPGSGAPAAPTS